MKICNQKGAAAVELAIVLPLLALLFAGSVEFGMLFNNKQVLTNASREGARAGITGENETGITQVVTDYCQNNLRSLGTPNNSVIVNIQGAEGSSKSDLSVSVNYTYNLFFISLLGFNDIVIGGRTIMKME